VHRRLRRQYLIGTGQLPGVTSTDHAELVAARRRISELEAEVQIHRRAAELTYPAMPPTVIAERIGWIWLIRVLSARVVQLRPAVFAAGPGFSDGVCGRGRCTVRFVVSASSAAGEFRPGP
jgi:hypothetical protein